MTLFLLTSSWTIAVPALAAVLVALLLLYSAMILRKYVRIMINVLDDCAPNPENGGESTRLQGEAVSFLADDGHRLEGVIVPRRDRNQTPAGMVVFAHEFGSDRTSCLRYCRSLLESGYDVFAFDFRNHGASSAEPDYRPRQWPSDRECADMLGALAYIHSYLKQNRRPPDVAVFGVSRGSGAAILASVGNDAVKAVITDGAFSSDTILEHLMRRFATVFARIRVVAENHPPVFWRFLRWLLFREYARRFRCRFPSVRQAVVRLGAKPMLLIHGEKDSYIPVAQSQALYDLASGPKSLWIVPGAKHNLSVVLNPHAYGHRIVRFLDEHLAHVRRTVPITRTASQELEVASSSFVPALAAARLDPTPAGV